MENIAYLFPGQGSQALGMGHAAANDSDGAKAILNRADDRLPFSLSELMKDGPEEQLKETANAQPALLTASIASLSLLEDAEIELVTWLGIVLGSIVRLLQRVPFVLMTQFMQFMSEASLCKRLFLRGRERWRPSLGWNVNRSCRLQSE